MKFLYFGLIISSLVSCSGGGGGPKVATQKNTSHELEGSTPSQTDSSVAPITATPAPTPATTTTTQANTNNTAPGNNTPSSTSPTPAASSPSSIPATATFSTGTPQKSAMGKWRGDCVITPNNDPNLILSSCDLYLVVTHQVGITCPYIDAVATLKSGTTFPVDQQLVDNFVKSMAVNLPHGHSAYRNKIYTYIDCNNLVYHPSLGTSYPTYGTVGSDGVFFDRWNGKGSTLKMYPTGNQSLLIEYTLNGETLRATLN